MASASSRSPTPNYSQERISGDLMEFLTTRGLIKTLVVRYSAVDFQRLFKDVNKGGKRVPSATWHLFRLLHNFHHPEVSLQGARPLGKHSRAASRLTLAAVLRALKEADEYALPAKDGSEEPRHLDLKEITLELNLEALVDLKNVSRNVVAKRFLKNCRQLLTYQVGSPKRTKQKTKEGGVFVDFYGNFVTRGLLDCCCSPEFPKNQIREDPLLQTALAIQPLATDKCEKHSYELEVEADSEGATAETALVHSRLALEEPSSSELPLLEAYDGWGFLKLDYQAAADEGDRVDDADSAKDDSDLEDEPSSPRAAASQALGSPSPPRKGSNTEEQIEISDDEDRAGEELGSDLESAYHSPTFSRKRKRCSNSSSPQTPLPEPSQLKRELEQYVIRVEDLLARVHNCLCLRGPTPDTVLLNYEHEVRELRRHHLFEDGHLKKANLLVYRMFQMLVDLVHHAIEADKAMDDLKVKLRAHPPASKKQRFC